MKTLSTFETVKSLMITIKDFSYAGDHMSFQMSLESLNAIAIATLNDWLKNLAPVFQPMRSKTKSFRTINWDDRETISVRRSSVPLFLFKSLPVFFVSAWCSLQCFRLTQFLYCEADVMPSIPKLVRSVFFFCRDHQRQIVKLLSWDFFLL